MSATNSTGYCVEVWTRAAGWLRQSEIFATIEEAEAELTRTPKDGFERRAYEVLAQA